MCLPFDMDPSTVDAPSWPLDTAWLLPKCLPPAFTGGFGSYCKAQLTSSLRKMHLNRTQGAFQLRSKLDDEELRQNRPNALAQTLQTLWVSVQGWGSAALLSPGTWRLLSPPGRPAPGTGLGQRAESPPFAVFTG